MNDDYVVNPISGRLVKIGSTRYKTLASLGVFNQKKKVAKFTVGPKSSWENELSDFIDRQSKTQPVHDVIKPKKKTKLEEVLSTKAVLPLPPTPVSSTESDESDDESDEDEDESDEPEN